MDPKGKGWQWINANKKIIREILKNKNVVIHSLDRSSAFILKVGTFFHTNSRQIENWEIPTGAFSEFMAWGLGSPNMEIIHSQWKVRPAYLLGLIKEVVTREIWGEKRRLENAALEKTDEELKKKA